MILTIQISDAPPGFHHEALVGCPQTSHPSYGAFAAFGCYRNYQLLFNLPAITWGVYYLGAVTNIAIKNTKKVIENIRKNNRMKLPRPTSFSSFNSRYWRFTRNLKKTQLLAGVLLIMRPGFPISSYFRG